MKIRHALIAVGMAAVAAVTTTPASAATITIAYATSSDANVTMVGTGYARTTSAGPATMTIEVSCQAYAVGAAVETGVGCYIFDPSVSPRQGYYVPDGWLPGFAATTGTTFVVPTGSYVLCLALGYRDLNFTQYRWMNQGQGDNCNNVTV